MNTTSEATPDSASAELMESIPAGPRLTIASTASRLTPDTPDSTSPKTEKPLKKPAKSSSPTRKTLYLLKKNGYHPAIVEHWNPHARIRQDLLGFIDVLALGQMETIAIQTCSRGDIANRRRKILEHPNFEIAIAAGWIVQIWGWKDYALKIERLT